MDAIDFLHQMHSAGMFSSELAFHERVDEVLREILKNSGEGSFKTMLHRSSDDAVSKSEIGLVGGLWTQTSDELLFGVRTAWKHARKCIMRSEHASLRFDTPNCSVPYDSATYLLHLKALRLKTHSFKS